MTRQEEGRRPSLGSKEGASSTPVPKSSSSSKERTRSASLSSSPTKLHYAPSLVEDEKAKKKQSKTKELQATDQTKGTTKQQQDKEKAKGNDAEIPKGSTEKKELKTTRRPAKSNGSSNSKADKQDEKGSENDDVEEEEEKSADESEEDLAASAATTSGSDAHTAEEEGEDERSSVGSGGLFFLRRRKSKAKAKQQEAKQREAQRSEKRQQLIKLKRLVEGDAAPLHVEFEIPGAERNVEFMTKKAAACASGKSKEEHSEESAGEGEDEDADSEETTTPKERRKNSLGSFGYGLWVPPSGRSRRAMTDSELVITEQPDVDVPMRRKGSLTKGPLVTTFALQRKSSDNSKSPSSKEKIKKEKSLDIAVKDKEKQKEKESDKGSKQEEERKKKLKILSRSAPACPASMNVLSEEDEECDDDEEDEDEEEGEEFEDEDDEDEDEDDERACRYNQDLDHQSSAYRDRSMSKEGSNDEELVPHQAFLDVVLMEAKDLLVLNKRAMRKLFKYKLFSPFLTVSVGQNTTRTKRSTSASPTFNEHLTFVYQDGGEEDHMLTIKLFYRCRTKAHRMRRLHVGTIEVPLTRLIVDKTHDMWLPIIPTCDYQLLWNWQKLGNDASNDALDARVSAKSKDRSRTRLGSVHLTVHKSLDKNTGTMRSLGLPSLALPLRLEVGDVILFHCSQLASHGAKLATRSRWDHVAMVAKHRKREGLYLFEATRDGVHLFNLDRRLAFYLESRTELGVRRLRTDRTKEMEDALHEFVAEVDGRPYKTNPLELLRALRDSNECDNLDTIFCSQLVAAAYQRMGILSQELCSNNYLPADFATTKISDNLIGAELDDVVLVMPVRQKATPANDQPFGGSGAGGSAPGSFQIGSLPF